ncbi:MAG: prephenate dehydrogenase/arogenate dehydrogenase family protein [Clostridiales bacterium]|nr:prephenate dehydrogenase/arogenate dehydrogenase family protein [Clostridiales bacterium]
MRIMFIGLGLIGGSMAMALSGYPDAAFYAVDRDEWTRFEALGRGIVRSCWASIEDAPLETMDVVILCLHPAAAAAFIKENAHRLKPGSLLTDVCGVKRPLHEAVEALESRHFTYLGGHPMAGRERGGFANATADLFRGSHYILTPDDSVPVGAVRFMERLVLHMGCADIVLSNPEAHDERIGYTSQLMHVMALALCDQHLLFDSYGFEGGSFRGATRVAALEPDLWTELFWVNKETLANLTDELIEKLGEYSALLRSDDREALLARLTASSDRKKEFDRQRSIETSKLPLFK